MRTVEEILEELRGALAQRVDLRRLSRPRSVGFVRFDVEFPKGGGVVDVRARVSSRFRGEKFHGDENAAKGVLLETFFVNGITQFPPGPAGFSLEGSMNPLSSGFKMTEAPAGGILEMRLRSPRSGHLHFVLSGAAPDLPPLEKGAHDLTAPPSLDGYSTVGKNIQWSTVHGSSGRKESK